jgi:uncharacterized SAM-binding protein YcdF (DUF218 family)
MKNFFKITKYLTNFFIVVLALDLVVVIFFNFYRPQLKASDAILVLGAAINTPASYNRALKGLDLYEQGLAPVIIVSGGQGFSGAITEAEYMKRVIESKAKKPIPIILEDNSHSTYENINNSKQELQGKTESLIIVSDSFHLGRAYLVALREGFWPIYVSSPDFSYYSLSDLIYYYAREIFAVLAYLPSFMFG